MGKTIQIDNKIHAVVLFRPLHEHCICFRAKIQPHSQIMVDLSNICYYTFFIVTQVFNAENNNIFKRKI